jgi:hypothetical protein
MGGKFYSPEDDKMADKKNPLINEAANTAVIMTIAALFKKTTETMRQRDLILYQSLRDKGARELLRLKKAADVSSEALADAMDEYQWEDDKINYMPEPWLVAARKWDDCDGSAALLATLIPGEIYCLVKVEQGKPKDYGKWHFIFFDDEGNSWSNYRLDVQNIDLFKYIRREYRWCTHLINLNTALEVKAIKKIK